MNSPPSPISHSSPRLTSGGYVGSAQNVEAPTSPDVWIHAGDMMLVTESMMVAIDEAIGLVLSSPEAAKTTVSTAYKMLSNACLHPDDSKYSSIRINNPAFQSKIGSVSGGLDLFIAAGFVVVSDQVQFSSQQGPGLRSEEMYLKHSIVDDESSASYITEGNYGNYSNCICEKDLKLRYCLHRMKDILDTAAF